MTYPRVSGTRRGQRGATLVIVMITVVLIMMLGAVAISSSSTQFKLAGNLQFEDTAMNNAEAAVAEAERWLSDGDNYKAAGFTTYSSTTPQLYSKTAATPFPAPDPLAMTWSDTNSRVLPDATNPLPQRYIIELVSTGNSLGGSSMALGRAAATECNKVNVYTITARGQASRSATKFVQSQFSVLSC